jgi:hypothetical protein
MIRLFNRYFRLLIRETLQLEFARLAHASTIFVAIMHFYGVLASLSKLLPNFSRGKLHALQNSANDMVGINMVLAGGLPVVWLIWKFISKPIKERDTKLSDLAKGWTIVGFAYVFMMAGGALANKDFDYVIFACGDIIVIAGCIKLLDFLRTYVTVENNY